MRGLVESQVGKNDVFWYRGLGHLLPYNFLFVKLILCFKLITIARWIGEKKAKENSPHLLTALHDLQSKQDIAWVLQYCNEINLSNWAGVLCLCGERDRYTTALTSCFRVADWIVMKHRTNSIRGQNHVGKNADLYSIWCILTNLYNRGVLIFTYHCSVFYLHKICS